jgi:acyl-CoA synthetase (AMP-forming)/AMP-acid ligase II
MIYTHTIDRARRYYPQHTALSWGEKRTTFRELHERIEHIAASLAGHGFRRGDRLAILLPNEPEYIELIYACSWLGVIAVPLNLRWSPAELDRVLTAPAWHDPALIAARPNRPPFLGTHPRPGIARRCRPTRSSCDL